MDTRPLHPCARVMPDGRVSLPLVRNRYGARVSRDGVTVALSLPLRRTIAAARGGGGGAAIGAGGGGGGGGLGGSTSASSTYRPPLMSLTTTVARFAERGITPTPVARGRLGHDAP